MIGPFPQPMWPKSMGMMMRMSQEGGAVVMANLLGVMTVLPTRVFGAWKPS